MPSETAALCGTPTLTMTGTARGAGLQGHVRALSSPAERTALAATWQELETRAHGSFYTAWDWIGCWLQSLPAPRHAWLLSATLDGRTIGLAVVVQGPWRRLKGLPVTPTWHLHASGDEALDHLCIEHNDFLLDTAHAGVARQTLLRLWRSLGRGACELHMPNLGEPTTGESWQQVLQAADPTLQQIQHDKPSYTVDLAQIRVQGHDGLAHLSANLRSQLRRSLRAYGELGPVSLSVAPDTDTACAWFEQLVQLHQGLWAERGEPGAFGSPSLLAFHHRLLRQAGEAVQVLRIQAGAQVLGYLYNFVYGDRVYYYQSGLLYDVGGKHARPGYVAHLLAIEHYARQGLSVYDFMMGQARYKEDLATHTSVMSHLVLRAPAWRFQLEDALRQRLSHSLIV